MIERPESKRIYEESLKVIPGGVNSPIRAALGLGVSPLVAVSGKDDLITDADGRVYIDYCMSWGALILGHAHPDVVKAAQEQIALGSSFGITTELEMKLAQKILQHIPSADKIRFVSSGTEATMTAIRLARGFTGRSKIVKFTGHYHGHSDSLLIESGSSTLYLSSQATSQGIPEPILSDTICLPFNDMEVLERFFQSETAFSVAAVIVEPIAANIGLVLPEDGFLKMLREKTRHVGALLIFDEVITGFRVGLQGAQGLYGIDPELTCLGKIIGGGFPLAAVAGKKAILDCLAPLGGVYQAGTLSGNPVAVSAGLAVLTHLETPFFYEILAEKAHFFIQRVRDILHSHGVHACINEAGSLCTLFLGTTQVKHKVALDFSLFAKLFSFLLEHGIYIPPSPYEAWFISSAHTEKHLVYTAQKLEEFFARL